MAFNTLQETHPTPLISVVVPAYNLAPYLPRCLDSLLSQQYSNLEIIVVNDGSTDSTSEVIRVYAEKWPTRIRIVERENTGVFKARLDGVANANGEWIGFVDGDDTVEPDMYRRLLKNALEYGAEISHCGYKAIEPDGKTITCFYNRGIRLEQDSIGGVRDLLSGRFVEPGLWNKLFHKSLFQRMMASATSLDTSVKINEDLYLNYYLFKYARKSIYEDFCSYIYWRRDGSASRQFFNLDRVIDPVKVMKHICDDGYQPVQDIVVPRYMAVCRHAYLVLANTLNCENEAQELKESLLEEKSRWAKASIKNRLALRLALTFPHLVALLRRLRVVFKKEN